MYKHIVFWKVSESADGKSKSELINEITKQLNSLPAIIPEIVDFEVGNNIGNYGASFFDVSLISSFKAEEDFKIYCGNPTHDKVVAFITSVVENEEIVDYVT